MLRRLFPLLFCMIILFSCNTNSSSVKTKTSDVKTTSAETNNAEDENLSGTHGIFSYTVKGNHIVARNYVQNSNLFINEVTNDPANGMMKIEVTPETSSVFKFEINNSGATNITNNSPSLGNFTDKKSKSASYMEGKTYKNYYRDSVMVTITNIDNNRVKGTFSGTFKADEDGGGTTVNITDGSFNLPFGKN